MKVIRIAGIVLLVAGIVVLVLALAADPLGIGEGGGFGRNQVIGTVVGAVVAVAGLVLTLLKR